MLGDSGRSFVVGFGENYPKQPHHKAAACDSPPAQCTWDTFNNVAQDNPHELLGALVGGPKDQGDTYQDLRTDYITNEVTLDYNAGFQGAVAGLKANACGGSSSSESPSTSESTGVSTTTDIPVTTTPAATNPTTTSTASPVTTSSSGGSGSCSSEITNSWANNVQGKLQITLPNDISDFTIELVTDIPLTNIQVISNMLLHKTIMLKI